VENYITKAEWHTNNLLSSTFIDIKGFGSFMPWHLKKLQGNKKLSITSIVQILLNV